VACSQQPGRCAAAQLLSLSICNESIRHTHVCVRKRPTL
jgi:hypothetical protein